MCVVPVFSRVSRERADGAVMESAMKAAAAQGWRCHECKALLPPKWVEDPKLFASTCGTPEAWCGGCVMKKDQKQMRKRAREPTQGGISTANLQALESQQVTFGKYDGEKLGDVPTSYLKWLVCGSKRGGGYNCDWLQSADPRLHRSCQRLLAYRLLGVARELD